MRTDDSAKRAQKANSLQLETASFGIPLARHALREFVLLPAGCTPCRKYEHGLAMRRCEASLFSFPGRFTAHLRIAEVDGSHRCMSKMRCCILSSRAAKINQSFSVEHFSLTLPCPFLVTIHRKPTVG